MALSTVVKHFTDLSMVITDDTGTPLSVTVDFTQADLSVSGWSPQTGNRQVTSYQSKGALKSVRLGEKTFPTVSFSVMFTEFADDATLDTVDSALRKVGTWASAVSTLGANAEVYAVDLTITVEGTDHGDAADYTMAITDFVPEQVTFSDGSPITLSFSGTVYGTITAS